MIKINYWVGRQLTCNQARAPVYKLEFKDTDELVAVLAPGGRNACAL
jgi:hypothetical protein